MKRALVIVVELCLGLFAFIQAIRLIARDAVVSDKASGGVLLLLCISAMIALYRWSVGSNVWHRQCGKRTDTNKIVDENGKANMAAKELLSAADKIGAIFEALLEKIKVNDSGEARVSACLCLTIAEGYVAALAVLNSRAQSHAPILMRSMHEALADLSIIVDVPNHVDQMRFDNASQMLRIFSGFQNDSELKADPEVQKTLKNWTGKEQATFDELQAKGHERLRISDKFKKAKMAGDYVTSYGVFCSVTHNNVTNLIARHGRVGYLGFTEPVPDVTLKSYLAICVNIYGRAVQTLPKFTNLSDDEVAAAVAEVEAIWDEVE